MEEPDILNAARYLGDIARQVCGKDIEISEVAEFLDTILHGERALWEALKNGLVLRSEVARASLERFQTWLENEHQVSIQE